jgi:hypothetical protein
MQFDELLQGPEWDHLEPILKGGAPVLVSAFYGREMLRKVTAVKAAEVKLLVRLPNPMKAIPKVLPNDPRVLLTFAKKNPSATLFADPRIHAKIFVSRDRALIGSANLSSAGFCGSHEASLLTTDASTVSLIRAGAKAFIAKASQIDIPYLERLVDALNADKTAVQPPPDAASALEVAFVGQAGNPPFEGFVAWLSVQPGATAKEVHARCVGKYNLTGHAYSAFHGLSVLFRGDPSWARSLIGQDWAGGKVSASLERIRTFVTQNPGQIKNRIRGSWETSYLPPSLGGPKARSGGAGISLIKMMMVVLPSYLRSIHAI